MGLKRFVGQALGPPHLDEVLMVFRVIGNQPGTMIDVGAHHGHALEPFLKRGWTVHGFEPDPANRAVLENRNPGFRVDTRAVSETDGDQVTLFTSDVSTGISTLSPFHATHEPTATVETVRLDTYLGDNNIHRVDFLKTDVEGYDLFALRSFPWNSHHPKAVVCEFEDNKTTRLGHTVHDLANFLQSHGYIVLVSEWFPIVEYGGDHRWRRFLRYPAAIPPDSWGNLIAIDREWVDALERAGQRAQTRLRIRQWVKRMVTSASPASQK